MGNTGSTNNQDKFVNQQYNFYDQELNEYKRMIIAQQEQINQLSTMNIKQNIKGRQTSNMFFNEIPQQQQHLQNNNQNNQQYRQHSCGFTPCWLLQRSGHNVIQDFSVSTASSGASQISETSSDVN